MKSDQLALVLASMEPTNAKALTVKLANRLVLPETTNVPAPPAAVPFPTAAAAVTAGAVPVAAPAPALAPQSAATPKT